MMSRKVPVAVTDGRRYANRYARRLCRYGLCRADQSTFKGEVSTFQEKEIMRYCKKHGLRFYYDNAYAKRSSSYRDVFFASHPPAAGRFYFCSYCGKPVDRNRISVDHLYPVGQTSKSLRLQRHMKHLGIEGVNSSRNLVPACERCNKKKGKKMGLWTVRGWIGRVQWLWYLRWALRFAAFVTVLYVFAGNPAL